MSMQIPEIGDSVQITDAKLPCCGDKGTLQEIVDLREGYRIETASEVWWVAKDQFKVLFSILKGVKS